MNANNRWCIGYRRNPHVPTTGGLIDVNQPEPPFQLCRNCWTKWSREDDSPTSGTGHGEGETMRTERMDAYSVGRRITAGQRGSETVQQTERKQGDREREVPHG